MTLPELDHYESRRGAKYFGVWPSSVADGASVEWPAGEGPRIFAYLKPSRGLGQLLDWIASQGHPTIVVGDGLDIRELRRYEKPSLRFHDHPLPLDVVGRECDVAILNATHGTTCSLLLAGKPIFQLPHNVEQMVTSARSVAIGGAAAADKDDGPNMVWEFSGFLHNDRYAEQARAFAQRYQSFDPRHSITQIADHLDGLAKSKRPRVDRENSL